MRLPMTTASLRAALVAATILAVGILVLPITILTKRNQGADPLVSHSQLQGTPPSVEEVSRSQSSMEKICFVRGAWVYLTNVVTGQETRLVEGSAPFLSPGGESVAFMSIKEKEGILGRLAPSKGRLKVLDLRTNKVRDFKSLADIRAYDPVWSNDGTRIAFTLLNPDTNRLDIGVLDPGTGDWRKVEMNVDLNSPPEGIYIDSWAPDDRSLLFHTLRALYEVRLDGGLAQIRVDEPFENGEISSDTRFSLSFDRRYLLFDRTVDRQSSYNQTITILDLRTNELLQVVPKTIDARAPLWLPSNKEILFTRVERVKGQYQSSICKIAIDGSGLTTLTPSGDNASYSVK